VFFFKLKQMNILRHKKEKTHVGKSLVLMGLEIDFNIDAVRVVFRNMQAEPEGRGTFIRIQRGKLGG
jgi:hypothetical protein